MKSSVIEQSSIDLLRLFQDISAEAKKEKAAIPPLNKLVYYWTRKPLIVSRAVVLASTLDSVDDVRALLHLNMKKRSYTYVPDSSVYRRLSKNKLADISFLDPFSGSGSITFEAKCLGLNCTSADYNPFAYMIEKASLEYPAKYGEQLAADVQRYALDVIKSTEQELGQFYSPSDLIYFWYWCITCPHCNQQFPLTNHMYLAKNPRNKIGVVFTSSNLDFTSDLKNPISDIDGDKFTQKRGNAVCIKCQNTIPNSVLTKIIAGNKAKRLVAIQTQQGSKRTYRLSHKEDFTNFTNASHYLSSHIDDYISNDLIPRVDIRADFGRNHILWNYGITTWDQFMNERQLIVMATFIKNTRKLCQSIPDQSYAEVISVYLGLLLCKHVNSNSLGVVYNKTRETPEIVTMLRRPSFIYNHVEINPFNKVRGSFYNSLKNIVSAIKFSARCSIIPKVNMRSVLKSDQTSYDLIITDPPYADDVQYGEISDFFYVWFYRCVKDFFPDLPKLAPLDEDFCESRGRFKSTKLAKDFFASGLEQSFLSMRRSLKNDGLLVVLFAHSTTDTWDLLLRCVINAKLQVMSAHVVHTESTSNVLARNKASFMSSIIITCRKLHDDSSVYFEDLKPQMFNKIDLLFAQFDQDDIITMQVTDLLIMVYGEVLEVATGHTELKSYEKDSQPSFDSLMSEARNYMVIKLMSKVTGTFSESLDPTTNLYILAKVFYHGKLSADELAKLAKAYGVQIKNTSMFKTTKGQILFFPLHTADEDIAPSTISNHDLYSQLRYIVSLAFRTDVKKAKSFLSSGDASTFNPSKIIAVISLFVRSYTLHINRGITLSTDEKSEFEILKNLIQALDPKSAKTRVPHLSGTRQQLLGESPS